MLDERESVLCCVGGQMVTIEHSKETESEESKEMEEIVGNKNKGHNVLTR